MPSDTSADAEQVRRSVLASMAPSARVGLAIEMSEELRLVSLQGLRVRNPGLTEQELVDRLVQLWHGDECLDDARTPLRIAAPA